AWPDGDKSPGGENPEPTDGCIDNGALRAQFAQLSHPLRRKERLAIRLIGIEGSGSRLHRRYFGSREGRRKVGGGRLRSADCGIRSEMGVVPSPTSKVQSWGWHFHFLVFVSVGFRRWEAI